jgi:ribosomal protein L21
MKYLKIVLILAVLVGGQACRKSGTKALERGDYYNAVVQSVEKLRKDTDNDKAAAVLPTAYKYASEDLLNNISRAKSANQQFRYERVVESYQKLNALHDMIEQCVPCRRLVTPQSYFAEAQQSKDIAAGERYDVAEELLRKGTIPAAREAYNNYEFLQSYAPDYKDVNIRIEEALNAGSFHVVVEQPKLNSRLFNYSHEYFQSRIDEFLRTNKRLNKFIRFYDPAEAKQVKLKPDHVVRLEFLDFVVGETNVQTDRYEVTSKDSVKVGTTKVNGKNQDVYGKVKARITKSRKVVRSRGVMLLEIYDFRSNKTLLKEELPGEFTWVNEWASYNGDERALNKEELLLTQRREELPPAPQQLFIEFCKPIYDQFTSRVKRFYDKY